MVNRAVAPAATDLEERMKLRRSVLMCAMVAGLALPGVAAALPDRLTFDPQDGRITLGEVITLIQPDLRESLSLVLTVQSERSPTGTEVRALLDGRELPGFTVLSRISSPGLDTSLNDLGPVFAKKAPFRYTITMVGSGGATYKIECTIYEHDDGSVLKVCEGPAD